jgi:hypothetical protein
MIKLEQFIALKISVEPSSFTVSAGTFASPFLLAADAISPRESVAPYCRERRVPETGEAQAFYFCPSKNRTAVKGVRYTFCLKCSGLLLFLFLLFSFFFFFFVSFSFSFFFFRT